MSAQNGWWRAEDECCGVKSKGLEWGWVARAGLI
eukprot:CAMPEP_0177656426 /NCGR_PEP_ID=MMETSP0447-20121125/15564_1 /TAXON_ID=0 /ORGANISM="Stygamoeba regulata, Strain BSH-02190019" /LENGTH=33 /DNA_ID= /DNA_START= /DNA_END= /DNA_ORIENTATION=